MMHVEKEMLKTWSLHLTDVYPCLGSRIPAKLELERSLRLREIRPFLGSRMPAKFERNLFVPRISQPRYT